MGYLRQAQVKDFFQCAIQNAEPVEVVSCDQHSIQNAEPVEVVSCDQHGDNSLILKLTPSYQEECKIYLDLSNVRVVRATTTEDFSPVD